MAVNSPYNCRYLGKYEIPQIEYEDPPPVLKASCCCSRIFQNLSSYFSPQRNIPPPDTLLHRIGIQLARERVEKGKQIFAKARPDIDLSNLHAQARFALPQLSQEEDLLLLSVLDRYQLTDSLMLHDYFANDLYRTMLDLGRSSELAPFQIAYYGFLLLLGQGQVAFRLMDLIGPHEESEYLSNILPTECLSLLLKTLLELEKKLQLGGPKERSLIKKNRLWMRILSSEATNLFLYCRDLEGLYDPSKKLIQDGSDLMAYARFFDQCKKMYEAEKSEELSKEVGVIRKKGEGGLVSSFYASVLNNPIFAGFPIPPSSDPKMVHTELMKWIEAGPLKRIKYQTTIRSLNHHLLRIGFSRIAPYLQEKDEKTKKLCEATLRRLGLHLVPFDFACRLKKALEMGCMGHDTKALVKRFRAHIDQIFKKKPDPKWGARKMAENAFGIEKKYLSHLDPHFEENFKEGDLLFNDIHAEIRFLLQFSSDVDLRELESLEQEIENFHLYALSGFDSLKTPPQKNDFQECYYECFSRLISLYQLMHDLKALKNAFEDRKEQIPPRLLRCFGFNKDSKIRFGSEITETSQRIPSPRQRIKKESPLDVAPLPSPASPSLRPAVVLEKIHLDNFPRRNVTHYDVLDYLLNRVNRGYYVERTHGHTIVKNPLDPKCTIPIPNHPGQEIAIGTLHSIKNSLEASLARIS